MPERLKLSRSEPISELMASQSPRVSVVIAAYNVTPYIAEALDSLRAQTFRNFETIVVNDGCPDTENLEKVLEPYRAEIIYLKQENQGVAAARNAAFRAARGELVSILDPDDLWEPNYLEVQTSILDAHPDVDLVYADGTIFGETPWAGQFLMDTFPSSGEVTFGAIVSRQCIVLSSVTVRRDALFRNGLFDPSLRSSEDFDLWLRMAKTGSKLTYHRQRLTRYRARGNSLSVDPVSLGCSTVAVYQKLLTRTDLTQRERETVEEHLGKHQADLDFFLGKKALYHGNTGEARLRLRRAYKVMRTRKLMMLLAALHIAPQMLQSYIHRRYPSEFAFLH